MAENQNDPSPTESYPRQQGLKQDSTRYQSGYASGPTESYPRQQGLKPDNISKAAMGKNSDRVLSKTTRIETLLEFTCDGKRIAPTESYPRQQGLKHFSLDLFRFFEPAPTESYPRQQGLKLISSLILSPALSPRPSPIQDNKD